MRQDRDYIFHGLTSSLCPHCLSKISAKIIIKDGKVYLKKTCAQHGEMLFLLEEDAAYYLSTSQYNKPGTVCKTQTATAAGCPFDCGLCPDHEQHSCINLIDITNRCDIGCPTCYAASGQGDFLPVSKIEAMMDFAIETEYGNAEILQISGGEPTLHPHLMDILRLAKAKKFKYVMLNTNGLNIAKNENLAKELGNLTGRFEVYLQFDGFKKSTYQNLRGRDLLQIKKDAIKNLAKYEVPITLVACIKQGINDDELGDLLRFGMETKYIRGINFQPIMYFGRVSDIHPLERVTLSGVISRIEQQTKGSIKKSDFVPLPCHPDRIALTYLYKEKNTFVPITRKVDIRKHLQVINNSMFFKPQGILGEAVKGLWSASTVLSSCKSLADFSCCIPLQANLLSKKERTDYVNERTFRISIVSFFDAYNFDAKSIKQECVHFITPALKKIPFSTYNLLYRHPRQYV
ncbi:MAG: radical SAM protein [Patescibacteria group bacterium]|nr:radical SAM protein [Patescibacteria group bacterium]